MHIRAFNIAGTLVLPKKRVVAKMVDLFLMPKPRIEEVKMDRIN
jgi:hypothetical protein